MAIVPMEGKDPVTKNKGPGGKPTKLTDELIENILGAVRSHQPINVAIALAGCNKKVFYEALTAGARAEEKVARGANWDDLTEYERRCAQFASEYVRAEEYADAVATRYIVGAATNMQITEKVAVKCIGKDENGDPLMVTETTVTKTPGDWRAMAWHQEHKPFSRWRSNTRIEVTGADGGPLALVVASQLDEIAAAIKDDAIEVTSTETTPEHVARAGHDDA